MCKNKQVGFKARLLKFALALGVCILFVLVVHNNSKKPERGYMEPTMPNQPADSVHKQMNTTIKLHLPIAVVIS